MSRAAALLAAVFIAGLAAPAAAQCRMALALALDVSGSVDRQEYRLQRDGLAGALLRPRVQRILLARPDAPVRLMAYEWSGPAHQRMLADWTDITSAQALAAFSARISGTRRVGAAPTTALGTTMAYGLLRLSEQADCDARTLDISGDGKANSGPLPEEIKPQAEVLGITINALVIGSEDPPNVEGRILEVDELANYFSANVISGEDSFVEIAFGFEDYERAMARKLAREIEPRFFSRLAPDSPAETDPRAERRAMTPSPRAAALAIQDTQ